MTHCSANSKTGCIIAHSNNLLACMTLLKDNIIATDALIYEFYLSIITTNFTSIVQLVENNYMSK